MDSKISFPLTAPGTSRRALLFIPIASAGLLAFSARKHHPIPDAAENGSGATVRIILFGDDGRRKGEVEVKKIRRSDAEWRDQLTSSEFAVTRQKGTEPAFTGEYWNNHEHGLYRCVCCGNALFRSEEKFESGTGWPSFWAPIAKENVKTANDSSYGMDRTEVECTKCDAHLGHVFDDGPKPTGLRYCMNSASLAFIKV